MSKQKANSAIMERKDGEIQSGKLFMYEQNKDEIFSDYLKECSIDTDALCNQISYKMLMFIDKYNRLNAV